MDNHELNPDRALKKEFVSYARKPIRKLRQTFSDIVDTSQSEAEHDFRKTTRDLQTIVDVCAIDSGSRRAKKTPPSPPEMPARIKRLAGWRRDASRNQTGATKRKTQ
jgi:hypothetical protein